MSLYELAILGQVTPEQRATLRATLSALLSEFDLAIDGAVTLHDAASVARRDKRVAFAATYFGGEPVTDLDQARELVQDSAPVIPAIGPDEEFGRAIPDFLQSANGLKRRENDPEMTELATAMLECVGLLRRQRRVFVSYRRVESRAAALQLHDLLNARGFDVFLDTHDIRPGDPFQDVLWHRLVDSDVMVMLDTPSYFDSRWTRQEIGRARAKEIQVLRVIWPGHTPNKLTDLAETIYLQPDELSGEDGPIAEARAEDIALHVEKLRSRSIAARYLSIVGKLRADAERIGAVVEGVGAHRAIAVRLLDGRKVWAFPVVGVPDAQALNDVADKARDAGRGETLILIYDHIGIREAWNAHLRWLDEQIKAVRAIRISDAAWALAAWEG